MAFTFLNDQGSTQDSSAMTITPGNRIGIAAVKGASNAGSGYYPIVTVQASVDNSNWVDVHTFNGGGTSTFPSELYVFSDVAGYLRVHMQQDNSAGRTLTVKGVEATAGALSVSVTSLPTRTTTNA